jgi:hypothetical protein
MNCLSPVILLEAVADLPVTEHFPDDWILDILHFFFIFSSATFVNIEVHLRVVKVSRGNIGGKHYLLLLLMIFDLKGSGIIILDLWLFLIVLLVLLFIFNRVLFFLFLFLVLILLGKRRRPYLFVVSGEIQMMLGDAAV